MGIEANAANWTSNWAILWVSKAANFSSIVFVGGPPTPSRSGSLHICSVAQGLPTPSRSGSLHICSVAQTATRKGNFKTGL